jgi:hypothetical protein
MIVKPVSRVRSLRLILLAFVGFGIGCAGPARPLADSDLIGCSPAIETTVRVKRAFSIDSLLMAHTYVLPEGEYLPAKIDRHGIFYASPRGIIEQSSKSEQRVGGGIYMPVSGGFYSFPSLYVDMGDGHLSKVALPEEVVRGQGQIVVFTRNGLEVVR